LGLPIRGTGSCCCCCCTKAIDCSPYHRISLWYHGYGRKNKNANACPFGFMATVKNGFWPPLSHRKSTTILILFLTSSSCFCSRKAFWPQWSREPPLARFDGEVCVQASSELLLAGRCWTGIPVLSISNCSWLICVTSDGDRILIDRTQVTNSLQFFTFAHKISNFFAAKRTTPCKLQFLLNLTLNPKPNSSRFTFYTSVPETQIPNLKTYDLNCLS
jgi:hypothetical protein